MGYRSDVIIVIREDHYDKMNLLSTAPEDISKNLIRKDGWVSVFFSNWKWYDSYEDVAAIEQWVSELEPECYTFIRMGEDVDDTEERGEAGMLYVSRTIERY